MTSNHHRARLTVVLLVALLVVAAGAAACSTPASVSATEGGAPDAATTPASAVAGSGDDPVASGAAVAKGASGPDMTRILKALGFMQAVTPSRPIVVLLGGSAARESTISDSSWRRQIVAKGGPATLAWNMGSRNRTMAQNVAIVKALPEGAQAIVFIGVNLGAFTSTGGATAVQLPSPLPTTSPTLQQPHQYTKASVLSAAKKRALVRAWLAERYPVFKRNFGGSARTLEDLIRVCRARGYRPVLFELPRNTAIIGSSLKAPTTRYRDKCRALAAEYRIPWVSLVASAKVPNSSFYDLWHLVEPGRRIWQGLLSARTASLLDQYGYDGGGS